jgi:hypothetical protein
MMTGIKISNRFHAHAVRRRVRGHAQAGVGLARLAAASRRENRGFEEKVFTFANDGGLSVKKSHMYAVAMLGMANKGAASASSTSGCSFPLLSSQNFRGTLVGLSWWRQR